MGMTKEQQAAWKAANGQMDVNLNRDLVAKDIKGDIEYSGMEGEYFCQTEHSVIEVLQDGFFDIAIMHNRTHLGARIKVTCKNHSEDPFEWTTINLIIARVKGQFELDKDGEIVRDDKGSPVFVKATRVGKWDPKNGKYVEVAQRLHADPASVGEGDKLPRRSDKRK